MESGRKLEMNLQRLSRTLMVCFSKCVLSTPRLNGVTFYSVSLAQLGFRFLRIFNLKVHMVMIILSQKFIPVR